MQRTIKFPSLHSIYLVCFLIIFNAGPNLVFAVNKAPINKISQTSQLDEKIISPPIELVEAENKKLKRALIFTSIGVGLLLGTIVVLSLGTMGSVVPLYILGLAAVFGNIGFIKAMRVRARTKSHKRSFAKARKRTKMTLILACVLGITLVFGLLHMLLDKAVAY